MGETNIINRKNEIISNLKEVKANISLACEKSERDVSEVTLLCTSKTYPLDDILICYEEGERYFGESFVQELNEKINDTNTPKDINWHMIGHLQTNKIKYIIDKIDLIHSVDTEHLAEAINKEAEKKNVDKINILVETNIADEATKYGNDENATIELIKKISTLPHLNIKGLMTSAPFVSDPEDNRIYFKKMKNLLNKINDMNIPNVHMTELSMGMSNDYLVAIEEGATIVRIGTSIFGTRCYDKTR